MSNVAQVVAARLEGESTAFLEDVVHHGIHNITNDYQGDSDAEYEAYDAEFRQQAGDMLAARERLSNE